MTYMSHVRIINLVGREITLQPQQQKGSHRQPIKVLWKERCYVPRVDRRRTPPSDSIWHVPVISKPEKLVVAGIPKPPQEKRNFGKKIYIVASDVGPLISGRPDIFYPAQIERGGKVRMLYRCD